jgi:hypothetical protein
MPFQSKAQQRWMFATNPEEAKKWAKETPNMKTLPDKKHPQINPQGEPLREKIAGGMFFQKAAQPRAGHFFRDLPGRSDAKFHEKSAGDDDGGDASDDDMQMNSTPEAGGDAGGGMYGTGEPLPVKPRPRPSIKSMLNIAGPGKTRPAVKVASASPSDWEADMGLPTGFHRPTKEQPEGLESGGERFHSTLAKAPDFNPGPSVRHGLVEGGSMKLPATASPQMGKHAAPRFLGTSFAKHALDDQDVDDAKSYAKDRLGELGNSLKGGGRDLAQSADSAIKSVTRSPMGAMLATAVAAHLGMGALKGVGRGVGRALGRKPKPAVGLIGHAAGGLRRLVTGK